MVLYLSWCQITDMIQNLILVHQIWDYLWNTFSIYSKHFFIVIIKGILSWCLKIKWSTLGCKMMGLLQTQLWSSLNFSGCRTQNLLMSKVHSFLWHPNEKLLRSSKIAWMAIWCSGTLSLQNVFDSKDQLSKFIEKVQIHIPKYNQDTWWCGCNPL